MENGGARSGNELGADRLTWIALAVTLLAWTLTLPTWFWIGGLSWFRDREDDTLVGVSHLMSFVFGCAGLVWLVVARRREQVRGSRAGQELVRLGLRVAIFGAIVWGVLLLVAVGEDLEQSY